MNDETRFVLNKELIRLDKHIKEYTEDIDGLFLIIKEKTDFREDTTKRRDAIYADLNA